MGHKNDYRVSTLIVLCKDCGQDVGLYPARHQCTSNKRPQLPTLCSSTTSSFKSWNQEEELAVPDLVATTPTVTRQASDSSMESGKWSFFRSDVRKQQSSKPKDEDKSVYFDTYASHLKNSTSLSDMNDSTTNGKKLWGKMKENEKWKDLVAEKKEEKPSNKLWKRIIDATLSNSSNDVYYEAAESDDDDWEGETHVSRILREYHCKNMQLNNTPLPTWLYDDRTPISALAMIPATEQLAQEQVISRKTSSRTRRLWQTPDELSSREKEIQALRDGSNTTMDHFPSKPSVLRSHSERAHNVPSARQRGIYNTTTTTEPDQVFGSFASRKTTTARRPNSERNILRSSPSFMPSRLDDNYF